MTMMTTASEQAIASTTEVAGPRLPGVFTETSYTLPPALAIEEWIAIGEALQVTERSIGWWLGDWWRYGKRRYGEMASQASKDMVKDTTGHAYETVRKAGRTAAAFEPGRRRPNVPFGHHQEVTSLPPIEADDLLDTVETPEAEQISKLDLREMVKVRKAELERQKNALKPVPQRPMPNVSLYVGDAAALPLEAATIDLIVTSPPYALEIEYGERGDAAKGQWFALMCAWMEEAYRVAKLGARLALNVPLDTTLGGNRQSFVEAMAAAMKAGWRPRSSIVWADDHLGKSVARGSVDDATAPSIIAPVEMIMLMSKGPWKREQPNGARSEIAHADWLDWTNGLWHLSGESQAWEGHPAPFPLAIPHRLIYLLSFVGDTVLDPFCGSGTTAIAAVRSGRSFVGVDREAEYINATRRRLAQEGL